MTLQQLAKSTKLSIATLQRIETNDFSGLPEGVYLKGYLRAYAREVGLNGDEVVAEYLQQESPAIDAGVPIVREPETEPRPQHASAGRPFRNLIFFASIFFLISAVAVALAAYQAFPEVIDELIQSAPPQLAAMTPKPPAPPPLRQVPPTRAPGRLASSGNGVATTPVPNAAAASSSSPASPSHANALPTPTPTTGSTPGALSLELHPTSECWISVVADGQQVVYRSLQAGERVNVTAQSELQVRVGDPSLLAYTLNGVPGRRLGQPGQPITVRITKDNFETFAVSATEAGNESHSRETVSPEPPDQPAPDTPER